MGNRPGAVSASGLNGDETWTAKEAGIRRRAGSGVRRDVDGRGHPQSGSDRGGSDGSASPDAGRGAEFKVAKNRLATLALEGTKFDGISPMLTGTTALAWSATRWRWRRRPSSSPRSNEKLELVGGALGARTLDAAGVKALAELPSLDQLRGKLLGLLQPRQRASPACCRHRPGSSPGCSAPTPRPQTRQRRPSPQLAPRDQSVIGPRKFPA